MENVLLKNNFTNSQISEIIESWEPDKKFSYFNDEVQEESTAWNFFNSFMFAFYLCTTIGYGDIAPVTAHGQVICIVYGIFGIPVNILFYKILGASYAEAFQETVDLVQGNRKSVVWRIAGVLTFFIPCIIIFILMPSGIFVYTDEWTYLEGIYYSFITLWTIGFGDYVSACTRRIYSMMGVYISYLAMGAVVFLAVEKYSKSENPKNKSSELIQSMVKTLSKENFTHNEIAFIFNRKRDEFERKNHSVVITWEKVFDERFIFSIVLIMTIGVDFKYYKCDCYSMNVVLMFTWLLLGRSFFFMCSNLLSYSIGTLILDQLDCKCHKRIAAKAQLQDIYDLTVEINWQLAKLKPVNFTKGTVIGKFQKTCTDDPQKITKEKLLEILQVLDKLDEALYEELECLEILDKPKTVEVCKPCHENIVVDSTSDAKSVK
ncbi:Potassium channel subfamily K member 16 like protein [Argiope bruennichi]|uniref:Potassium channel subfamily K member 16 like protein n=1 Tax=Argiope bruennichi TaxID=94029 RepID=A0A8T0F0V9_ARGBR|nr:Potassium channel subfamily K member 16 like protein [Argiope bruennichi]